MHVSKDAFNTMPEKDYKKLLKDPDVKSGMKEIIADLLDRDIEGNEDGNDEMQYLLKTAFLIVVGLKYFADITIDGDREVYGLPVGELMTLEGMQGLIDAGSATYDTMRAKQSEYLNELAGEIKDFRTARNTKSTNKFKENQARRDRQTVSTFNREGKDNLVNEGWDFYNGEAINYDNRYNDNDMNDRLAALVSARSSGAPSVIASAAASTGNSAPPETEDVPPTTHAQETTPIAVPTFFTTYGEDHQQQLMQYLIAFHEANSDRYERNDLQLNTNLINYIEAIRPTLDSINSIQFERSFNDYRDHSARGYATSLVTNEFKALTSQQKTKLIDRVRLFFKTHKDAILTKESVKILMQYLLEHNNTKSSDIQDNPFKNMMKGLYFTRIAI